MNGATKISARQPIHPRHQATQFWSYRHKSGMTLGEWPAAHGGLSQNENDNVEGKVKRCPNPHAERTPACRCDLLPASSEDE